MFKHTPWGGFTAAIIAALAGLLALGCVDPNGGGGSTSGTALYAFDGKAADGADRILVWNDLTALYANPSTAPNRRIRGKLLDEQVKDLAWNGMVVDIINEKMYLVSKTGNVVRINYLRRQNGALSALEDIDSFVLGDPGSDRLNGGTFGQACLDASGTGTLYVAEYNNETSRIWVVPTPQAYTGGAQAPKNTVQVAGDKGHTGITLHNGTLFASFENGSQVTINGQTYSGARLRRGTGTAFLDVVFPPDLKPYGALAYDSGNTRVFFARHLEHSSTSGNPLLIYKAGVFGTGLTPSPDGTLGPASINRLRVLAHGGNKDWLTGASSLTDQPLGTMYLWKSPGGGSDPVIVNLGEAVGIKGLALDGNN